MKQTDINNGLGTCLSIVNINQIFIIDGKVNASVHMSVIQGYEILGSQGYQQAAKYSARYVPTFYVDLHDDHVLCI